jgi:Na+-transporting NADH:ubiquinone oxidoreductase subunit F
MDFIPGSYAQIKIPKFEMDYNKDIDKDLIGAEYLPAWEKFGLFGLKCKNEEETIRAKRCLPTSQEAGKNLFKWRQIP